MIAVTWIRRIAVLLIAVSMGGGLAAPGSAEAAGAAYTVLKCHVSSRGAGEAVADSRGPYATLNRCPASEQRLEILNNGFGTAGQQAGWRFRPRRVRR